MDPESWAGSIDLGTPAGALLTKLIGLLPAERHFQITVFGSAPLQIQIESGLTSADVDLFSDWEGLDDLVHHHRLGTGQTEFYVQVSSELNFRTSPKWRDRVQTVQIANCTLRFPHPIDILIAKLNRLDEKDVRAFQVVIAKTGHPTEAELIHELQEAVDLFRPSFDEEQGQDMANNCRRLWKILWNNPDFDPRTAIIAPALERRRKGYGEPARDYKSELREAAEHYRP